MQFDHFGTQVSARYQLYVAAVLGAYSARLAAGTGKYTAGDFRNDAYAQLITLGNDVRRMVREYLYQHGQGARAVRTQGFEKQLDHVAQQMIITLANRLQLGAQSLAGVLIRGATGAIGTLIQQRLARPVTLTARDSAGRAWVADKLVAFLARDFAYQTYIDHQIGQMLIDGAVMARVVYPDPEHVNHNLEVRLDNLGPLRPTVFHPNASAVLAPYIDYVPS